MFRPKNHLQFCTCLVIFPLKYEWNRSCTILRVHHVIKLKALPKNTLLKNSQSWYSLVTSLSTWLSSFNCQLHCLLPLLSKLSCSTHGYQNNFNRPCICINLIERENFMTAFTTQLVLCELFPDFQWTSFIEIAKQIIGTYKFLHRWTKNFWNNNKFGLLRFLM